MVQERYITHISIFIMFLGSVLQYAIIFPLLLNLVFYWACALRTAYCTCTVPSLGLLGAIYDELPAPIRQTMTMMLGRVSSGIIWEQHLCSSLHGLAGMKANWHTLPQPLRDILQRGILSVTLMHSLCLSCTVYSLGMLGAEWDSLPDDVTDYIIRAICAAADMTEKKTSSPSSPSSGEGGGEGSEIVARSSSNLPEISAADQRPDRPPSRPSATFLIMSDRTVANSLYGLSLMGVSWGKMDSRLRSALLKALSRPQVFAADVTQHVCNAYWALGKMGAAWQLLPTQVLEQSLLRCVHDFKAQELSNSVYGLAIMHASWEELSPEFLGAIADNVERLKTDFSKQVRRLSYLSPSPYPPTRFSPFMFRSPKSALVGINVTANALH